MLQKLQFRYLTFCGYKISQKWSKIAKIAKFNIREISYLLGKSFQDEGRGFLKQ